MACCSRSGEVVLCDVHEQEYIIKREGECPTPV